MYKKKKPLTCVCDSENIEVFNESEKYVMLFCFDCKTRNFLTHKEYAIQFEDWLKLKIEKCRLISQTNKNKN